MYFWIKNKKNRHNPANPIFYIKVEYKGVYITRTCYPDATSSICLCSNALKGLLWLYHSSCVNKKPPKFLILRVKLSHSNLFFNKSKV